MILCANFNMFSVYKSSLRDVKLLLQNNMDIDRHWKKDSVRCSSFCVLSWKLPICGPNSGISMYVIRKFTKMVDHKNRFCYDKH